MIKKALALFLTLFAFGAAFAQMSGTQSEAQAQTPPQAASGSGENTEDRLRLAISSLDYPVTPGDVYRLNFRQSAGTLISQEMLIDGMGVIDLGVFGKIDASGLTFIQLKQKVEELIAKNYTFSLPNLSIITPGIFRVCIRDGASRIQYRNAWGLSRLSEVVADIRNSSTSLRNVELISLNQKAKIFDLLKAALSNESGLDPLVRPGDTVMLHVPGRTVQVLGEVRRPGMYELLRGEGLKALIETFGGGLSNRADPSRVRIDRTSDTREQSEYISLPGAYVDETALNDGDVVIVRSKAERLPLIWFEGAVSGSALTSDANGDRIASVSASENAMGRFSYPIRKGQMMSDILQDVRPAFLPLADLSSAALFTPTSDVAMPVNIQALLTGTDASTDVALSDGYRIVIPSISTEVLVSGAVYSPGFIPHKQNANVKYYMTMAGGTDPSRNAFGAFSLYDQNGKQKKASAPIMPGDRIHVQSNSLAYTIGQSVPLISSVISLLSIIITLAINYWPHN